MRRLALVVGMWFMFLGVAHAQTTGLPLFGRVVANVSAVHNTHEIQMIDGSYRSMIIGVPAPLCGIETKIAPCTVYSGQLRTTGFYFDDAGILRISYWVVWLIATSVYVDDNGLGHMVTGEYQNIFVYDSSCQELTAPVQGGGCVAASDDGNLPDIGGACWGVVSASDLYDCNHCGEIVGALISDKKTALFNTDFYQKTIGWFSLDHLGTADNCYVMSLPGFGNIDICLDPDILLVCRIIVILFASLAAAVIIFNGVF